MIKFLKKIIPSKVKIFLGHIVSTITELVKTSNIYMFLSAFSKKNRIEIPKGKKMILVNTPVHPNLGDQAIAIAEIKFIKQNLGDFKFLELNDGIFFKTIKWVKKFISEDDIIMCHGGGNMGIEYFWCEKVRRTIIKFFPKNKIIVFPQTIYYGDDLKSRRALKKSQSIYKSHNHLFICAREKKSYEILKEKFLNCKIELVPDIVLSLGILPFNCDRQGVLCCFRDDREKNVSKETLQVIESSLSTNNIEVSFTDTVLKGRVAPEDREFLLREKLKEFASARIVITDRLHGMIFSYLTNTPCIVMGNYNHKVEGMFSWFNENGCASVAFLRDVNEFLKIYQSLIHVECNNDVLWADKYYQQIIDFIYQS